MRTRLVLAALAAVSVSACTREPSAAPVPEGAGQGPEYVSGEEKNYVDGWVRIRLDDEAAPLRTGVFTRGEADSGNPLLDELAAGLGATEIREVFPTDPRFEERHRKYGLHLWFDIRLGDEVPVSRAEQEFAALPGVRHAQPIYRIVALDGADYPLPSEVSEPSSWEGSSREMPFNDPGLKMQWHYDNDGTMTNAEGETVAVEGADIGLFEAWEMYGAGDPSVIVAVMDTGVFSGHEDLQGNMWVNEAELNGTAGKDDDGNGYRDDIHGYDFYKKSPDVEPGEHGTHVAGTIAAVNDNGIGVSGVAGGTGNGDGVRIMTIGWSADNRQTIPNWDMFAYAADNGAVIASCSWEVSSPDLAPDLQAGLDYFIDNAGMDENGVQTGPMKGGLIMFAAGNSGENRLKFPSYYDRVVSVASMAPDYNKASYSNWAPEVDILAPGGEKNFGEAYAVYSTYTDSGYAYIEGTSMATPHVSGVAALIVSEYGKEGFTSDDLRKRLLASFRPISPVVSGEYANQIGVGLVDASLITLEDPGVSPGALENYGAEGLPDSVRIYCRVPADGNGMPVVKYRLEYAEKSGGSTGEWQTMDLVNTADAGEDYEYRMMLVQLTTYAFRMTPVDRFGNEGSTVEFEATTLQHTNRPPTQKANFLDVEAAKAGEKYSKKFKLAYYFIEPDEAFGDALTFTVTSSDEDVVSVVMTNGSDLELVPLKQGESTITVRATDKGGLYVESSFKFTVLENAFENIKPRATKEFGTVRMAGTGAEYRQSFVLSEYFTDANLADGDVLTFSFTNTNEAVVGVTVEEGSLVVEPIAEGTASVTVTATDLAGESAQSVLTVQVGSVPAGDGGLLIAPNPVGETLSMHFAAAAGVGAEAVIYDAAARRVLSENVEFDGNGTGTLDVSALAPGIYTLSVKTEGGIAGNGTFVKR